MKTYEQLLPKFSNEPGLVYRDMFVYPNNSMYRGQMKKKDEASKKMLAENNSNQRMSYNSQTNGAFQDDDSILEFRHGYGIQYWTDGAHYEGQWYFNKAEG